MPVNPFVGTWQLVSAETRTASGEVDYPFGEDAIGYLTYTPDGHMSAAIMHAGRINFASPDARAATSQEKLAAFDTYLSYCGAYTVDGDKVIHHVHLSLLPNWTGVDLVRLFEFSGDRLSLRTLPMLIEGVQRTAHLIWRRVPPLDATIQ